MSDEEATSRWEDLHSHVATQTAQAFVTSFLLRCIRANIEHLHYDTSSALPAALSPSSPTPPTKPTLDIARILPRYRHSQKRFLLFDLEGTLWIRDSKAILEARFVPPNEAIELLNKLADVKANEVWVLSGLPVKGAMEVLEKMAPKVGLV